MPLFAKAKEAIALEGAEGVAFEQLLRAVRDTLPQAQSDELGIAYRDRMRAISDALTEQVRNTPTE